MEMAAMAEYFRQRPHEEGFWLPLLAMEAARKPHHCDICEMEFAREGELIQHEDEHVVCDLEGCKFTSCKEVTASFVTCRLHFNPAHCSPFSKWSST